jgi:hypothetical protein
MLRKNKLQLQLLQLELKESKEIFIQKLIHHSEDKKLPVV